MGCLGMFLVQAAWWASCRLISGWWEPQARGCDLVPTLSITKGLGRVAQAGDPTLRDTGGAEDPEFLCV